MCRSVTRCNCDVTDADHNYQAEFFGASSMCFRHRRRWTLTVSFDTYRPDFFGSGCYKVRLEIGTGDERTDGHTDGHIDGHIDG